MSHTRFFRATRQTTFAIVSVILASILLTACTAPYTGTVPPAAQSDMSPDSEVETLPLAPEATATAPSTASTYALVDPGDPICSSLVDIDPIFTGQMLENLIFWTWHVNFLETPSEYASDVASEHFGCLRFYFRDASEDSAGQSKSFNGGSAFLLTECFATGNGIPLSGTVTIPSTAGTPTGAQQAEFDGESGLKCPINLHNALEAYFYTPQFDTDLDTVSQLMGSSLTKLELEDALHQEFPQSMVASEVVPYDYLSIIGVTGNHYVDPDVIAASDAADEATRLQLPTFPIAYYEPGCAASPIGTACPPPLMHALGISPNSEGGGMRIITGIDGNVYSVPENASPPCESAGDCSIRGIASTGDVDEESKTEVFTFSTFAYQNATSDTKPWIDFCLRNNQPDFDGHALVQEWRTISGLTSSWQQWCAQALEPDAISLLDHPIDFWVGDATIYIGNIPHTDTYFKGSMYEVWVDPDRGGPQPTD